MIMIPYATTLGCEKDKKRKERFREWGKPMYFRAGQWENSLSGRHQASMGKTLGHTSHHQQAYSHRHMLVLLVLHPVQALPTLQTFTHLLFCFIPLMYCHKKGFVGESNSPEKASLRL